MASAENDSVFHVVSRDVSRRISCQSAPTCGEEKRCFMHNNIMKGSFRSASDVRCEDDSTGRDGIDANRLISDYSVLREPEEENDMLLPDRQKMDAKKTRDYNRKFVRKLSNAEMSNAWGCDVVHVQVSNKFKRVDSGVLVTLVLHD